MQHLDEGMIHAWLDGQLPRDEAQSVEAHVADCRQCADAVAEARGLIAASSRILTTLDGVPREVVPKQPSFRGEAESAGADVVAAAPSPSRASQRAQRRWFGAGSLAAAAMIVVAVGTVTVMRRGGRDMVLTSSQRPVASAAASGPAADSLAAPTLGVPAPSVPTEKKTLGDSRAGASAPRLQAPPTVAPSAGAPSDELGRVAASEAVRERSDEPARLEARRLVDSVANLVPPVARAKANQQNAQAASANKPADELAKDLKEEGQQARQGQVRAQTPAVAERQPFASTIAPTSKTDSAVVDRSRQLADEGAAMKRGVLGAVRGRITDANSTGVAGAMVSITGTKTGVVTNAAGEFSLGGLPSGSYQLVVRRIGYEQATRDIAVAAGQTLQTDLVLNPTTTSLANVVVTGSAASTRDRGARAAPAAPAPTPETPPGAPITATQSNAVGCYELGITALTASRNGFRQIPRRVALDTEIVPANAEGIWYRARDLARTGSLPNGLWRPTGPDAIELEWTYGSRTARIRVAGLASSMMRGTVEEIDRATATGEAANVVAVRRACEG